MLPKILELKLEPNLHFWSTILAGGVGLSLNNLIKFLILKHPSTDKMKNIFLEVLIPFKLDKLKNSSIDHI